MCEKNLSKIKEFKPNALSSVGKLQKTLTTNVLI